MLARASSCVGSFWCHAMFKIKYCHQIFDDVRVRFYTCFLLREISQQFNMLVKKIWFDSAHMHFSVDIELRSKPKAAKIIKGVTGKKILNAFPEIKRGYFLEVASEILLT